MLQYQAAVHLPMEDEEGLAFLVEKVREVACPRLHITFEAASRRQLAQKLNDLNVELRARGIPIIDIESFSHGSEVTHGA